jgi:hypothetical protein
MSTPILGYVPLVEYTDPVDLCRPSCDDADLEEITDDDMQTTMLRCRSCGHTMDGVAPDVAKVLADAGLDADGSIAADMLIEADDGELADVIDIDQARQERRASKARRSSSGSWGAASKILLVGSLIILAVMALIALID